MGSSVSISGVRENTLDVTTVNRKRRIIIMKEVAEHHICLIVNDSRSIISSKSSENRDRESETGRGVNNWTIWRPV